MRRPEMEPRVVCKSENVSITDTSLVWIRCVPTLNLFDWSSSDPIQNDRGSFAARPILPLVAGEALKQPSDIHIVTGRGISNSCILGAFEI
jgi:hypothetical protein